MMQVIWKDRDITGLVLSVVVEHAAETAGREARVQALYAPTDERFACLNPTCGDSVTVKAADAELFAGTVERVDWDSDGMHLELVCLEPSALLAKNEVYRAFSGTPKTIATELCRLCALPVGSLWDKPGTVFLPPTGARSLFSLLREAYGGDCITESHAGALVVRPMNERVWIPDNGGVRSLRAAHSCENAVTGAGVVSAQGKTLAAVTRPEWEAVFGPRRRVYHLVGAQSGAQAQALAHLAGMARTGQLELPGDAALRCGDTVRLDLGQYGLRGDYRIGWIAHRLEAGDFTTTLGVTGT